MQSLPSESSLLVVVIKGSNPILRAVPGSNSIKQKRLSHLFYFLQESEFPVSKSILTLISLAASITLNVYLVHRVKEELENNDSLFNEATNYLAFLVPKLQEEDMIAFAKKIKLDEEFYKIVGE